MSPRDSVMTCARISVPHLLGSFPLSATFTPTCFFTSCAQLEHLPLFSLFCPNLLFLFLSALGASSSFFSLMLQPALSLPIHNWSIFLFFLSFAPTRSFSSYPQLEHLPLFYHFSPNSPLCLLSAIGASSSVLSLFPQLALSLPIHDRSISRFFLIFAPTHID